MTRKQWASEFGYVSKGWCILSFILGIAVGVIGCILLLTTI